MSRLAKNAVLAAATAELRKAGLPFSVSQGRRHIRISAPGLPPVFCASSPSDHRAAMNMRSVVRRIINRMQA